MAVWLCGLVPSVQHDLPLQLQLSFSTFAVRALTVRGPERVHSHHNIAVALFFLIRAIAKPIEKAMRFTVEPFAIVKNASVVVVVVLRYSDLHFGPHLIQICVHVSIPNNTNVITPITHDPQKKTGSMRGSLRLKARQGSMLFESFPIQFCEVLDVQIEFFLIDLIISRHPSPKHPGDNRSQDKSREQTANAGNNPAHMTSEMRKPSTTCGQKIAPPQ